MSHLSDAVQGVCGALDHCFAGYDDSRRVSTSVRYPMNLAAIVDFSIMAKELEVYGSLAVVVDIANWSGVCFLADFSRRSRRWLEHGPIGVEASEAVRELVTACSNSDCFDFVVPSTGSATLGFLFDLGGC